PAVSGSRALRRQSSRHTPLPDDSRPDGELMMEGAAPSAPGRGGVGEIVATLRFEFPHPGGDGAPPSRGDAPLRRRLSLRAVAHAMRQSRYGRITGAATGA